MSPSEERLSLSSDSVSLPTQIEVQQEPVATDLTMKMTEVSLEDIANKTQDQQSAANNLRPETKAEAVTQPDVNAEALTAPTLKPEATKEDGPQDLRVFELNSDSGKSTPSNNGKKGRYLFSIKILLK